MDSKLLEQVSSNSSLLSLKTYLTTTLPMYLDYEREYYDLDLAMIPFLAFSWLLLTFAICHM